MGPRVQEKIRLYPQQVPGEALVVKQKHLKIQDPQDLRFPFGYLVSCQLY